MKDASVLILGGAGFVGSAIAAGYCNAGWSVSIVDGLLPGTGGRAENLARIRSRIRFVPAAVEEVGDLKKLIAGHGLIVDAMAWTSHQAALERPEYDLRLNAASHLHVIRHLKDASQATVLYLGSRSQYGNPPLAQITEETPMVPEDVQGIHKLAAESYYRVYAKLYGFNAISLRFPNCFGEHQPVAGDDIGLIGSFIRDALAGKTIEVYGSGRTRSVVYVNDVVSIALRLSRAALSGFTPFNISGSDVAIGDLATTIVGIAGSGACRVKELPKHIQAIDAGAAVLSDAKLRGVIGAVEYAPLRPALEKTVAYFKEALA